MKAAFAPKVTERIASAESEGFITPEIEAAAKQVKYLEGESASLPDNPALEEALIRFGELTGQSDLSLEELHLEATIVYNEIAE